MTIEILLRYLHFICIFGIVSSLVAEHILLKTSLKRREIGRVAKIDGIYGFAVLVLLAAGMTLWLGGYGKPMEFYTQNALFQTKLAMFLLIGLLSIYPTVFFFKKRKGDPTELVEIPKSIFWSIRLELLLVFTIPLLAGLMAKGISLLN